MEKEVDTLDTIKNNNKMTAEEQYNKAETPEDIIEAMKEFAKYHVQKALEEAATEAKVEEVDFLQDFNEIPSIQYGVNSKSILNAYPLENIK